MKTSRNYALLYNWVFIPALLVLALNDHYLKWHYHNWFTGKLSDFAGLLILPMVTRFVFPKLGNKSLYYAATCFIFWKLPISDNFIVAYNKIALIPITRVVDYTDLIALSILPASYFFIKRIDKFKINSHYILHFRALILIPVCVVFMATSAPLSYYMKPGGDIHIGKTYKLKISKDEALRRLSSQGFAAQPDTSVEPGGRIDYYVINNVVLNGGRDTIQSIQIGFTGNMEKPTLVVNNIKLTGNKKLSDWRQLRDYSKHYRNMIKAGIIEEIK